MLYKNVLDEATSKLLKLITHKLTTYEVGMIVNSMTLKRHHVTDLITKDAKVTT